MKNKSPRHSKGGFTIVEIIITTAILGIIGVSMARFIAPYFTIFSRSNARQQVVLQGRQTIDTIRRFMSNGQVSTLTIPASTPATLPVPPIIDLPGGIPVGAPQNSSASFTAADGSAHYCIYWDVGGKVYIKMWNPPTTGNPTTTWLASNVTNLAFASDFRDPGIVTVTLQIDAPLELGMQQGAPGSNVNNFSLLLDNQTVRMLVQ